MKLILFIIISIFLLTPTTHASKSEEQQLIAIESVIKKYGINLYMEKIFEMENRNLPLKKDYIDTITSIYYIKTAKTRTYKHILSQKWVDYISSSAKKEKVSFSSTQNTFATKAQKNTVNSACSVKLSRMYLKYGIKIMHIYSKQDGTFLFSTEVKEKDCLTL